MLSVAGAEKVIASPAFKEAVRTNKKITLCNASGTHVISIPPFVISTVLAIYHRLPAQILIARVGLFQIAGFRSVNAQLAFISYGRTKLDGPRGMRSSARKGLITMCETSEGRPLVSWLVSIFRSIVQQNERVFVFSYYRILGIRACECARNQTCYPNSLNSVVNLDCSRNGQAVQSLWSQHHCG